MIGAFNIDELRQIRSQLRKTESLLRARGYLFAAEHIDDKPVIRPISPATLHSLESAEPIIGVVPSDIIQFAHIIGEVDFRGIPKHHPDCNGFTAQLVECDPIFFELSYFVANLSDAGWIANEHQMTPGQVRLEFAPDYLHKADISGGDGYEVLLPAQSALIDHLDIDFATYIRRCAERGFFWRNRIEDEGRSS